MRVAIYSDFHSIPGKPMSMACYSVHLTNISIQKASVHLTNIYIYIYILFGTSSREFEYIHRNTSTPYKYEPGGRSSGGA